MAAPDNAHFDRRQLIFVLLALIAIYVIVPQIGSFRKSLPLLMNADLADVGLAVGATILTYFAAAGTYFWLALKPLIYLRTFVIQVAGAFVNRLLPAGIGGIGLNFAYLRRSRHDKAAAASVVAVNNMLGFIGHGLLLVVLLLLYSQDLPGLHLWHQRNLPVLSGIVLSVALVWIWLYSRYRTRIRRGLKAFFHQLTIYRHRSGHLVAALGCSLSLTLCNVLGLWLCVQATGGDLPFIAVFIVFSFGIALGTATPTPGGLGGVEAGLVAGLTVYHLEGATALAAVLIYRLLSYWLPMLTGLWAFVYSQRRSYI